MLTTRILQQKRPSCVWRTPGRSSLERPKPTHKPHTRGSGADEASVKRMTNQLYQQLSYRATHASYLYHFSNYATLYQAVTADIFKVM